jgi:hypothetical protein
VCYQHKKPFIFTVTSCKIITVSLLAIQLYESLQIYLFFIAHAKNIFLNWRGIRQQMFKTPLPWGQA